MRETGVFLSPSYKSGYLVKVTTLCSVGFTVIPICIGKILFHLHSDQGMVVLTRTLLPLIFDVESGIRSIAIKFLLERISTDVEQNAHERNDRNLEEGKSPVEFVVGILPDNPADIDLGASMLGIIIGFIPAELPRKLLEFRRIPGDAAADGSVGSRLIDKMIAVGVEPDKPADGAGLGIVLIGNLLDTIDFTGCDVTNHPHDGFTVEVKNTLYRTNTECVVVEKLGYEGIVWRRSYRFAVGSHDHVSFRNRYIFAAGAP